MRLSIQNGKNTIYEIVFQDNFKGLSDEIYNLELQNRKAIILSDTNVEKLYMAEVIETLKSASMDVYHYIIEAGEENKTLKTVESIYEFLIQNKVNRNDVLVALGGGVIGDVTGYIAATYLRGIDFIQIPTTLLSQVDSSIGGKTGVDFNGYKNMIGAFHMPKLVYTNLSTLVSLEERQFYSGFAEVMKAALIGDAVLYEWLITNMYEICDRDIAILKEMIYRSCSIKKRIVEKDPFEKGDRALLNLGHTIGHAIESSKNFELLHGECVALGCVAAAYISYKKELLSSDEYYEIRDMFVPFNLPISIEDIDPKSILELTKSDKKALDQGIKFVLLKKIGKAIINTTVTDEEILEAINEIYYKEEDLYE